MSTGEEEAEKEKEEEEKLRIRNLELNATIATHNGKNGI